MLNLYSPNHQSWREELKLRYWQFVLQLTRLAGGVRLWVQLFSENRALMALAFLTGVLIGFIPLFK